MIEVIQPFLAPAVMFSAGGLLCLAQFARYNAIIALVRTFNRERLSILQEADQVEPKRNELLLQRAQGLEQQAEKVLAHAVTVKNALRFLVGGILLMVLFSLTIGAALTFAPLGVAAIALFVLGLLSTFMGLCLVLAELRVSLEVVEFEHENLSRLQKGEGLLPPELAGIHP
jgi:ABC-type multidrug transport system fused ATPase/permease subunit